MANSKISALTSLAQASVVPASDVLPIVNASTTKKVTVDALINAQLAQSATTTGIGVTSPVLRFAVERDSGSGYVASFRSASGNPYITIQTTGGITQIQGINAGFTDVADIGLQPSGGNVKIGAGNLVISTSGKGIDFSATPGTGTSELLADYEEGTFSPTIAGSTTAGTATYAAQIGSYTKVGNIVQIQIYLSWSGHTGTGNMRVEQLPFTQYPVADFHASPAIGYFVNIALTAGNIPQAYGSPNTTRINIGQIPTGGGAFSNCPMDAAGEIMLTMVYRV